MVSDREKEFEFQRHILWHFRQASEQRLYKSLLDSKNSMGLALRILRHACLMNLRNYVQSFLEEVGLSAKSFLGLKLKRGHTVSCLESCVPYCFSFRCPKCVERPA